MSAWIAVAATAAVLCIGFAPGPAVAKSSAVKFLDGHGYVYYDANYVPETSGVMVDAITLVPVLEGHIMDFAGNDLVAYSDGTITDDNGAEVGFVFHDVVSTGP